MFHAFVFLIFSSEGYGILWDNSTSYEKYQLWQLKIQDVNLTSETEKMLADKEIKRLYPLSLNNVLRTREDVTTKWFVTRVRASLLQLHQSMTGARRNNTEDVWHRTDNNIDLLLNGNETEYWNKFLESQNISHKILFEDVQRAIEKEGLMKKYGDWRRGGKIDWTSHPTLSDIYNYLKSVAAANPKSCSLQSLGKTVHKKDITALKLSNGKPENEAILLEAGLHGQEWVAVVTLLYFIEHIAWNFTKQPDHIKNKDWYIIPVMNPDGYEYSMTKDRLWRKNRKRFSGPCDGVDLNRNFDINWRGNSDIFMDICSMNYAGPVPFSEKETIALRDLINNRHFIGYVSVHSYGSALLFPWIYDGSPTVDAAEHTKLAKEIVGAMSAVANVHYRTGTVSQLHMRKGSGNSLDWAYSRGVKFTYALETRGGLNGQFVDSSELLPAAREVVAGLKRMAEVIL